MLISRRSTQHAKYTKYRQINCVWNIAIVSASRAANPLKLIGSWTPGFFLFLLLLRSAHSSRSFFFCIWTQLKGDAAKKFASEMDIPNWTYFKVWLAPKRAKNATPTTTPKIMSPPPTCIWALVEWSIAAIGNISTQLRFRLVAPNCWPQTEQNIDADSAKYATRFWATWKTLIPQQQQR